MKSFFKKKDQNYQNQPTKFLFNTPYAIWMRSHHNAWWIIILCAFIIFFIVMIYGEICKKWYEQNPVYPVKHEHATMLLANVGQILIYKIGLRDSFIDDGFNGIKRIAYNSAIKKIPENDGERYIFLYDLMRSKACKKAFDEDMRRNLLKILKGLDESEFIKNKYQGTARQSLVRSEILGCLMNSDFYKQNSFSSLETNFLISGATKFLKNLNIDQAIMISGDHVSYVTSSIPTYSIFLYIFTLREVQNNFTTCNNSLAEQYITVTNLTLKILDNFQNPKYRLKEIDLNLFNTININKSNISNNINYTNLPFNKCFLQSTKN